MSPSFITIDPAPDLDFDMDADAPASKPYAPTSISSQRTLLLAPPSIAAHESKLHALFSTFDRASADLQMLDRLSAGLVSLPDATYDLVLLLTDTDGSMRAEATALLTRDVFARVVPAMRAGARLAAQDGAAVPPREAVLAGLVADGGAFAKPDDGAEQAVPLRFGNKKKAAGGGHGSAGPAVGSVTVPVAGKLTTLDMVPPVVKATPVGVGFVDLTDDFDLGEYESGDELVPDDELMTEEERNRPIQQPPECPPGRKRACKDCTCGLAQRLEKEDKERRANLDKTLGDLKANLTEMDFTVQGKTGSCGSCALGDAFRCADCPYIGLPPFKPGEEVSILNNIPQL